MLVFRPLYSFGFLFIYCELGNQMSSHIDEINEMFYNLQWQTFPPHVQELMPFILLATQQPSEFKAFGNYPCTRDTFKTVMKPNTFDIFSSTKSVLHLFTNRIFFRSDNLLLDCQHCIYVLHAISIVYLEFAEMHTNRYFWKLKITISLNKWHERMFSANMHNAQ